VSTDRVFVLEGDTTVSEAYIYRSPTPPKRGAQIKVDDAEGESRKVIVAAVHPGDEITAVPIPASLGLP
jgi:hypothetical protein